MADELKASPTFPGQELIGSLGRVAEQLGISLQDATKIISRQGNSPIKAFLADLLVAAPLRSAGTALQDWTGTPRDLTEEHPYSRLLSGKGMTMQLDPRVLDVAQFAAPVASAGVKGAKLAGKGAKALGPTAAKFAEDYMMSTGMMLPVVKPKGGNWVTGGVEDSLKGLKPSPYAADDKKAFEEQLSHMLEQDLITPGRYTTDISNLKSAISDADRDIALGQFVDKQLTRYVKNEMGTREDPVRLAVDAFPAAKAKMLADKQKQIDKATADMEKARAERGFTPEMMTRSQARIRDLEKERELIEYRTGLHYEPQRGRNLERQTTGTSPLARDWENSSDAMVIGAPYGDHVAFENFSRRPDALRKLGGEFGRPDALRKLGGEFAVDNPEALAYVINRGKTMEDVGFYHIIDELRNATNPASGLPKGLLLKQESLSKLSVPQAVEHVDKINAWRAAQEAEVDLARANNVATVLHKDFPESGMRWVELKLPEALPEGWSKTPSGAYIDPQGGKTIHNPNRKSLEDALKHEGEQMKHCVGGYCPDVESGRSRIFSLRDAKHKPHATVEVQQTPRGSERAVDYRQLSPENYAAKYGDDSDLGNRIVQIKGPKDGSPKEEYFPYIQDFVRSGKWSDVGDFENTGLIEHNPRKGGRDPFITSPGTTDYTQIAEGYYTPDEYISAYIKAGAVPDPRYLRAADVAGLEKAGIKITDEMKAEANKYQGGPQATGFERADPDALPPMKRGGPVNLDAMQMAVWNKDVSHKQTGGLAKAIPSNLAKLMKLLTTEAPLQAPQIRKALGQAFTTGNEHSVVGPTHSTPNESGRVGRITTQGKDSSVVPNQFDVQNAVRGKSSIVDFHSHPVDSGRAFSTSPSSADFNFAANEYFAGPQSRELKTLIASPADTARRTPTEYSFFATDTPGKVFDRRAREAAVYELQRSGKNTFKDVLDDPRFRDYFESGGHIGDWAEDVAPLAFLKLREAQALGRGKLQLSGKPLAASGGTNIELYDLMQPAATEFLRKKGFNKGGPVNLDAMQMAVWNKPVKKFEGGEPTQAEIEAAMLPATVNPNLQRQAAKIKSSGERDLPIMGPLELGAQVLSGLAAIPFAAARGIYEDFSSRKPGNPYSGQAAAKQGGDEVLEAMTYQPRTAPGQDLSQAFVHLLEASKLPPYIGHMGAPHVVPGAGRMLMENATAPGDPFFAGPVGRQRGAVKPLGNLNLQPAIAVETLKGPEIQTLDSFLNQSKSMPGVTKEGFGAGLGAAQIITPSSKMSKSDFEKYVAPSKYEKVKLADDSGDVNEHLMDEAHMEAQARTSEQMTEIGVPRNLQGAFTDFYEQYHRFEEGTPVSQMTENKPLRNWLDRQGYRTIDDVSEELQDATDNITERLYRDAMTEAGEQEGVLPPFYETQRLVHYEDPLSDPYTYEAVGVTHPSETATYRHFPYQPNMVGHFRGALMHEVVEAEGGVKIPRNAFLVEEIQSDSQQNKAMSGHLHQIHATIAKAAIQHALEMGADSVYFPSSIPISEVRSGSEKTQKLFRRVYDTEVMKGAIDPLRKMKGVTVTGVGKVLGDVGDPKFLYHEVKFSPDAKEQILKGKGQLAPGYKQGGPVNLDAMRMAVWNKDIPQKQAGGGPIKKLISSVVKPVDLSRRNFFKLPEQLTTTENALPSVFQAPVAASPLEGLAKTVANKPVSRREFLEKTVKAATSQALKGAIPKFAQDALKDFGLKEALKVENPLADIERTLKKHFWPDAADLWDAGDDPFAVFPFVEKYMTAAQKKEINKAKSVVSEKSPDWMAPEELSERQLDDVFKKLENYSKIVHEHMDDIPLESVVDANSYKINLKDLEGYGHKLTPEIVERIKNTGWGKDAFLDFDKVEEIVPAAGDMKRGGSVNLNAMRMAVTNKQLRKRHG